MDFVEYDFIDNQLISETLDLPIDELKKEFRNDCYGLANELTMGFMASGVLAATITFKNGHELNLKVKDHYTNEIKTYAFHSVIMLGNCVIDLLHSDRYISTGRYIKEMKKLNPELRLDKFMTEQWYGDNGQPIMLDINALENYK